MLSAGAGPPPLQEDSGDEVTNALRRVRSETALYAAEAQGEKRRNSPGRNGDGQQN